MICTLTRDRTLRVRGAARNLGGRGKALPFAPVGEITAGVIKQGVNVCRCRFAAKMLCVRSTRHSLYTCSLLQGSFYFHITSPVSPKVASLVTKRECVRESFFFFLFLSLCLYIYIFLYIYIYIYVTLFAFNVTM